MEPAPTPTELQLPLRQATYARYMHLFEMLRDRLPLDIHTTEEPGAMANGDIFLFNHFTRLETTVPPYLLFHHTGTMVRAVAYGGLFKLNDTFSHHLRGMGAVPTDMPGLLPFLAAEILRGRKVVIYPEGGIVRDKRVLDDHGNYVMHSGTTGKIRKHHKGAAALAVTLDILKNHIRGLIAAEDTAALLQWQESLHLTPAELRAAVEKPTLIVPGTITYYPLRNGRNGLVNLAERLLGKMPAEAYSDIVTETNMLLHRTDMYLHFGTPMKALPKLGWAEGMLAGQALKSLHSVAQLFAAHEAPDGLVGNAFKSMVDKHTERVRAEYARRLYSGTAVNINHVAATLIAQMAEKGLFTISQTQFHKIIYLSIKQLQRTTLNLHCTVTRPSSYGGILSGTARSVRGFMHACETAGLVTMEDETYHIAPTILTEKSPYELARIENPVQVHVNEIAPIKQVSEIVAKALREAPKTTEAELAAYRFADELIDFEGQRSRWGKKAPDTVYQPTFPHSGRPYFLLPQKRAKVGVLMVHGFAALPSEMRSFADTLHHAGYAVLGLRLPGHGTSFLDMEDRPYTQWLQAVETNYRILAAHVDKVVIVGFSTGAALSLTFAATHPAQLAGVASVAAPLYVQDANMHILPLVMPIRRYFGWLPGVKALLGTYPYGDPESHNGYTRAPLAALNELRLLIKSFKAALPAVTTPVLLLQGTADQTVKPSSAPAILARLGTSQKQLTSIPGAPHGLVAANIGPTWKELKKFIRSSGGLL
ncbi:MAG: alpha/beta fold hydrolase [Proteobacteria bacterium]|nr:alpha/beta fold hydrolase [Pseudomonadota bacterium]